MFIYHLKSFYDSFYINITMNKIIKKLINSSKEIKAYINIK